MASPFRRKSKERSKAKKDEDIDLEEVVEAEEPLEDAHGVQAWCWCPDLLLLYVRLPRQGDGALATAHGEKTWR